MLDLYRQLFDALHTEGVDYCVWKNTQELSEALNGQGDIDLYIAAPSHTAFRRQLARHGFIRVHSAIRHPAIEHHYGFDTARARLCHLHCHFRLITGESHIKQYAVPIDAYAGLLPASMNEHGVQEMHPCLQFALYRFRRCIKLSCVPGLLLFLRERRGYFDEADRLSARVDPGKHIDSGWLPRIAPLSTPWRDLLTGLGYRWQFRHWNRHRGWATPWYRYRSIGQRLIGKLSRRRKTFAHGVIVDVIGRVAEDHQRAIDAVRGVFGHDFEVRTLRIETTDTGLAASGTHHIRRGALVLCDRRRAVDADNLHSPSARQSSPVNAAVALHGDDSASIAAGIDTIWQTLLQRNLACGSQGHHVP